MTHSKTPMADRRKETSANGSPIRNPSGLQFSEHILPPHFASKHRSSNPENYAATTTTCTASCARAHTHTPTLSPSLPTCPNRRELERLYTISQALSCCKLRRLRRSSESHLTQTVFDHKAHKESPSHFRTLPVARKHYQETGTQNTVHRFNSQSVQMWVPGGNLV